MKSWKIASTLFLIPFAQMQAEETHEEPQARAVRAIPMNRQDRETLGPALCLNEIETNLWNILGSKWGEGLRRTKNTDTSEAILKHDLEELLAPNIAASEKRLKDQKEIVQGLEALDDSLKAFGKDFNRQVQRDFGDLLKSPEERCKPGADGSLSPICLVYTSFAQNHDPKYLKTILNSYGKFHSNFSEDSIPQFSSHFPLDDGKLGNPKSLEKLNFFLSTKYSVYSGFIQQWQERLAKMEEMPAHKMSPRTFERELGEAIGRSKTLSTQSLAHIPSYKDSSKKWDYIQAESQRLVANAEEALALSQNAAALANVMQEKRNSLRDAMIQHDSKVKNDKAKILSLSREVNDLLHNGGTYKVQDKIKSIAAKLSDFLKGKIPDNCAGRATASTLSDAAKFYQKSSQIDPNQFVIDLIEHAKDLDPSCNYVKTGNSGGNAGNPQYRKLFVASFLRNVCGGDSERDVRFQGPQNHKNDALDHATFRSDNAWNKWLPMIQKEVISGDSRYAIHPEHMVAAQSAHIGSYVPKSLIDSYALMYSLGQRETGSPTEPLPSFSANDSRTKELGFFHASLNTRDLLSRSSRDLVFDKAHNYYLQLKSASSSADFNEICRIDAFPGKYKSSTNQSLLKDMSSRCSDRKYLNDNYHACLGTLVAYCPTATLDYESFVVREARQNHGPLLLSDDPEYASAKRPATPVPACSAMFTLLAANSKFLCQNLDVTANYQVK